MKRFEIIFFVSESFYEMYWDNYIGICVFVYNERLYIIIINYIFSFDLNI